MEIARKESLYNSSSHEEKSYFKEEKRCLIGLSPKEIGGFLKEEIGVPSHQISMRVAQLWHWLYKRGAENFSEMATLSGELRTRLESRACLTWPEIVEEQISSDGTRKWLLRLPVGSVSKPVTTRAGLEIETVYIPDGDRGTLCVSSQVGCTLACSFCHTGTQKLLRNLTESEILGQILVARARLGDFPGPKQSPEAAAASGGRLITNIVMMGMGEPLYNFESVRNALLIASEGTGLSLSKRRITVSTSGVVPMIPRTGAEIGCMLAISLHAVRDEIRDVLVPINRKWNIATLLEACRRYPGLSNAKRITFEYVMLKGVNDSCADAWELARLLKGIPAKVNLIPFNPWPGAPYRCTNWEQIEAFSEILNRSGYASPIRMPRGQDILAACGQLKSQSSYVIPKKAESVCP